MNRIEWNKRLKEYSKADNKKAIIQIFNTVIPYIGILTGALMNELLGGPLVITILLSITAGFFMVRTFILFHDCTHDSFFTSKKMNIYFGHVFGILSFTPFYPWKKDHGIHHGNVGNLDKRGVGDVWTLTVQEYMSKPWYIKGLYRLFRNPAFLFLVAPYFLFLVLQRFPSKRAQRKEHMSYFITNTSLLTIAIGCSLIFGFGTYFLVQSIALFVAGATGVWLFYVQHQFEDVYWEKNVAWNSVDAALQGSTFYKLPLVIEWVSGYIGYHHIHHLNARIPNYNLKASFKDVHELTSVKAVTLFESIPLAFLQIYDEKKRQLISFHKLSKSIHTY